MMLQSRDIGKPNVHLSGAIFFSKLENFTGCHRERTPSLLPALFESRAAAVLSNEANMIAETRTSTQEFGTVRKQVPIGLSEGVRKTSSDRLNQVLADTMSLRDLYKKHHWQVSGPTFYQLHLLFDKHFTEQSELVDTIAERIQSLGGVAIAMAADIAETTKIPRPPKDREDPSVQIERLLEAHGIVLEEARAFAKQASEAGDEGSNDMLISDIVRTNELQVWFIAEHQK
jgi:starvation-inducible DNA-binding protein